jgi:PAS domain S-box-containing protein
MENCSLIELICALDILVFERHGDESFAVVGSFPDWFNAIYPDIPIGNKSLDPSELSPFLENFLIDATTFWNAHDQGQLASGPWVEVNALNQEHYLEATAVATKGPKILLVELGRSPYLEKQQIIQKGRQLRLDFENLEKIKHSLINASEILELRIERRTAELANTNELLKQEIKIRKQSEEALRQNEQFLQDIFDAIQDGIAIINKDFDIIRVNRWQEKMYGRASEQIGQKCYRLYRKQDFPCSWCASRKTLETGEVHRQVVPYLSDSGLDGWIELSSFPLKDADGHMVGIIEYSKDITEKIRGEEREAKIQAQLIQAQKMEAIGTLAAGIAHDFNNILGAIIGFADLALFEAPPDSRPRRHMQNVLDAGNRARELVAQILSFSSHTQESPQRIEVDNLVMEVVRFIRAVSPSNIEVRHQPAAGIRPVMAVPTQIHQVVMNLCTNAAQSMSEQGGIVEVKLSNATVDSDFAALHKDLEPGPYVRLTVSDTGAGMPGEILSRVFEPYYTTKGKGKGTGLGLAIVHRIVRNHGGVIEVESEEGKGSSFVVYLPAIDKGALAPKMPLQTQVGGKERILFIDDEETLATFGEQALGHFGYHVTAKTDNIQALDLFRQSPNAFDLILCDVTMPKLSVDEMVSELLRIRPNVPIILYTGFSESLSTARAQAMGARALLLKPLTMASLAGEVRRVLDGY